MSSASESDDDTRLQNENDQRNSDSLSESDDELEQTKRKKYTKSKVKLPTAKKRWISDPKPRVFESGVEPYLLELTSKYRWSKYEKSLIEKEMLDTIVTHNSDAGSGFTTFNISKIEMVVNGFLWQQYQKRKEMFKAEGIKPYERLLWHGTDQTSAIIKTGFDIRYSDAAGMYGAGIYFAKHSSKSNQYVYGFMGKNGCPVHKDSQCKLCDRKLLLCRVLMGRSKYVEEANKYPHAPEGYTSVVALPPKTSKAKTVKYPEYIVYSEDQVKRTAKF